MRKCGSWVQLVPEAMCGIARMHSHLRPAQPYRPPQQSSCLPVACAEPELTWFKPSEVAAASLIVGVHGTCPDSLAGSVQAALLARFPRVGEKRKAGWPPVRSQGQAGGSAVGPAADPSHLACRSSAWQGATAAHPTCPSTLLRSLARPLCRLPPAWWCCCSTPATLAPPLPGAAPPRPAAPAQWPRAIPPSQSAPAGPTLPPQCWISVGSECRKATRVRLALVAVRYSQAR